MPKNPQAKTKPKDDPTKDPGFMRVVDHFLKTPHKPHKESLTKSGKGDEEGDDRPAKRGRRQR